MMLFKGNTMPDHDSWNGNHVASSRTRSRTRTPTLFSPFVCFLTPLSLVILLISGQSHSHANAGNVTHPKHQLSGLLSSAAFSSFLTAHNSVDFGSSFVRCFRGDEDLREGGHADAQSRTKHGIAGFLMGCVKVVASMAQNVLHLAWQNSLRSSLVVVHTSFLPHGCSDPSHSFFGSPIPGLAIYWLAYSDYRFGWRSTRYTSEAATDQRRSSTRRQAVTIKEGTWTQRLERPANGFQRPSVIAPACRYGFGCILSDFVASRAP